MSNDWTKMWESKPTPKQEETKVRILPETEPDWQQVRIQASIAAMDIVKGAYNVHNDMERLVRHSVKLADALIKELKGGQDD